MNQKNSMNARQAERIKIISEQKAAKEVKPIVEEVKIEEVKAEDKSKTKKAKK